MGIFKAIGNFVKKIAHGVRDVFRGVRKGFSKLMGNKFFRYALMAVSIFSGAGAVLAAFQQGGFAAGMSAAGNLILDRVASIVTTPLKLITKGISGAGSLFAGAGNGLSTFADGLTQSLSNFQDAAGSVFGGDISSIKPLWSEEAELPGGETPMDIVDVAGEGVGPAGGAGGGAGGLLEEAKDIGPRGAGSLPSEAVGVDFDPAAAGGGADASASSQQVADLTPKIGKPKVDLGAADAVKSAGQSALTDPGMKRGNMLTRAIDYGEEHPVVAGMLSSGIASAFGKDEETASESMRNDFLFRNNMFKDGVDVDMGARSSKGLRERNKGIRDRAKDSRSRIRGRADRSRNNIMPPPAIGGQPQGGRQGPFTVGQAAGFGANPKVYKPLFTGTD